MKIIIAILFILPLTAWSQTCSELEYDLLNIENRLLNSQIVECEDADDINCRTQDHNNLTYAEVLQNYNKAMSSLVIHKGIEAITAAIEGGHNSLFSLTPERINSAKDYLDILEVNLSKAEVLEVAMTPIEASDGSPTSFWTKYNFSADISPEAFEDAFRAACRIEVEPICAEINRQGIVFKPENPLFETLYGFAKAEMRRATPNSDPTNFYNEHREKLKITVIKQEDNGDSSTSLSTADYRERFFGVTGKMRIMRTAIRDLEAEPEKELYKTRIIAAARDLDPISTSYAIPDSTQNLDVNSVLKKHLERPLADLRIDLTDGLTTDIWKNNLARNIEQVLSDQEVLDQGLNQRIEDFVEQFAMDECSSEQSKVDCFKTVCSVQSSESSCSNSRLNSLGAGDLIKVLNQNNELRSFGETFKTAKACYEENTLDKKADCLKAKAIELGSAYDETSVAKLEQELEDAKAELERYNRLEPFKSITEEKVLAIAALESSEDECLEQDNLIENTCSVGANVTGLDQGAIRLGNDLGNVSIRLSRSMVLDAKGAERVGNQQINFDQSEITFRENCEDSSRTGPTANLCQYYQNRETTRIRIGQEANRQRERDREVYASRAASYRDRASVNWDNDDRSNLGIVGSGIMQGLTMPNPITGQTAFGSLISGTVGYFQTKDSVKTFSSQIKAQSKLYDAQQAYALANRPPYSDVIPYYGGYIHNGHLYDKNFQSQAAAGSLYAPMANPLSYNFQTSLPGTGVPVSSPVTTPTTPSGSIPFSFGI